MNSEGRAGPTGPRQPFLISLGRVRGVPVVLAPSWLLIMGLLCFVYAPILRDLVGGVSTSTAYLAAIGFAVVFGACILAHEIGHTLVSVSLGHPVRRIVLFVLGGVSEIDSEPERARDELLIAAAGPIVSLIISGIAFGGYSAAPAGSLLMALLGLVWWSNLVLAVFNLLPGLPLDGGRLLRAAVCAFGASSLTGTKVAAWGGRLVAVALAVVGLFADRSSLGVASGVFSVAMAAYLWFAAGQSLRQAMMQAKLPDIEIARLLRPGVFVAAETSVADALSRAWNGHAQAVVVLDSLDHPSAIVDEARIGAVPPQQRPWTSISTVARPLEPGLVLHDDVDAAGLFDRLQKTPAREYLVVRPDGSAAGVISARDFVLQLHQLIGTPIVRGAR